MDKRVKGIVQKIRELFAHTMLELDSLKGELGESDKAEYHADNVYAMREAEKYAEELLKEIRKAHTTCQKVACLICMKTLRDGIITDYCSGKPVTKIVPKVPAKRRYDPEGFDKLMAFIGVSEEVYLSELVRFNWPEVIKFCNDRLSEGKNLPCKIDDEMNHYGFTVRKRKEIE